MAASGVLLTRPSQFDRFLHATIGRERNGMDLNVVFLLARLAHDPWAEATQLAGLPRAAAADSLAATIARLPAGSRPQVCARVVALCRVPLLPDQASPAPDAISAGKSHDGRLMFALLAGVTFSSALVLGLLAGVMVRAVSHEGPRGATGVSRLPPAERISWPTSGGPRAA